MTYIDYEGRSDGDSIKKIINQMKPRQLVIVHGPPDASADLAESCRASSKDIKVYTPKLQETVDATSETHIYQVRGRAASSGLGAGVDSVQFSTCLHFVFLIVICFHCETKCSRVTRIENRCFAFY